MEWSPPVSAEEYDQSARDTIAVGVRFTYEDAASGAPRVGYYDPTTNLLTALSDDETRIFTHFHPWGAEDYLREDLPFSTYPERPR